MAEKENNINLTGDEARMLMIALMSAQAALPAGSVLQLYMRLLNLSNVQPPEPRPPMNVTA